MVIAFFTSLAAVIVARAAELALGYYLAVRRQRRMQAALSALIRETEALGLYVPPATPSEGEMN